MRSIYSLSCVVVIRFGLQKPVRVSYVLRFFLTKRQTFLRSSLLYTIQYNVVMNEFQRSRSYNGYFALDSEIYYCRSLATIWRSMNSRLDRLSFAIFPDFTFCAKAFKNICSMRNVLEKNGIR